MIAAGCFLALPRLARATRAVGSGITGVLRDLPFVTVTILNGALSVQYVLLDIAMPLWVVRYTHAPAWSVAPLFLINTMMIMMLQVRTSRGTEQLPAARRAVQRSGWAFAVGALTFAGAHWTPDGLVAAVLAAAVVAHTVGELWHAGATFGISFELAPASAQGQYQGLFSMGMGLARTIGPALVTLLTITWGPPGWICVAAYFVLVSRALSIAIRWAERRRPRLLSCAAPSRSDVHPAVHEDDAQCAGHHG